MLIGPMTHWFLILPKHKLKVKKKKEEDFFEPQADILMHLQMLFLISLNLQLSYLVILPPLKEKYGLYILKKQTLVLI